MVNYEKMFRTLFNGMSDAITSIEKQNFGLARDCLIKALRDAEDIFADGDE